MAEGYVVLGDEETTNIYDGITWQFHSPPPGGNDSPQQRRPDARQTTTEGDIDQEDYPRVGPSTQADIGKPRTRGLYYPREKTMGIPTNVEGDKVGDALQSWRSKQKAEADEMRVGDKATSNSSATSTRSDAMTGGDAMKKLMSYSYAPRESNGNEANVKTRKKSKQKAGTGKGANKPPMTKAYVMLYNSNADKYINSNIESKPRWKPKYLQNVPAHLNTGIMKTHHHREGDFWGRTPTKFPAAVGSREEEGQYVTSAMDERGVSARTSGEDGPMDGLELGGKFEGQVEDDDISDDV